MLSKETGSDKDYENCADEYLSIRDTSNIGSAEVKQWCRKLGAGADVIDLGAGGGYPITRVLHAEELNVWAMDASATLLSKFKDRFPHVPAECTRVQNFEFFGRSYNGALAIGLIFLLSTSDQVGLISSVSGALVEGGSFLFTAPEQKCSWTDVISGTKSKSLGKVHYKKLLERSGFRLNSTFTDDGGNYYFDATLD